MTSLLSKNSLLLGSTLLIALTCAGPAAMASTGDQELTAIKKYVGDSKQFLGKDSSGDVCQVIFSFLPGNQSQGSRVLVEISNPELNPQGQVVGIKNALDLDFGNSIDTLSDSDQKLEIAFSVDYPAGQTDWGGPMPAYTQTQKLDLVSSGAKVSSITLSVDSTTIFAPTSSQTCNF